MADEAELLERLREYLDYATRQKHTHVSLTIEQFAALLRTPAAPPPAHAELAARLRAMVGQWDDIPDDVMDRLLAEAATALEAASLSPPAHAALAAELRAFAKSCQPEGMRFVAIDEVQMLNEAATVLGGGT